MYAPREEKYATYRILNDQNIKANKSQQITKLQNGSKR